MEVLRNRLVLLHHFSDIFCPLVSMFQLAHELPADSAAASERNKLRGLLLASAKETVFKKVIHGTMVRDRQHGPLIELNRMQMKRSKSPYGKAPFSLAQSKVQFVTVVHIFLLF